MAEIFVPKDNPESYLQTMYQRAFWRALNQHAPSVLKYLREHGVDAWLERYGLPREPWYQVGVDYVEAPHSVVLRNFWYSDTPPPTPRLEHHLRGLGWHLDGWDESILGPRPRLEELPGPREYDPSFNPRHVWRERVFKQIDEYMAAVERAYTEAGWQRGRLKYNPQHFVWLALRLEGKTCAQISNELGLRVGEDAVARATRRLALRLGTRLLGEG